MRKLGLYFLTIGGTQLAGFITFPLLTKNLSVTAFGHYSLILSVAGLVGALSTAWLRNVAFRLYFEARAHGETANFLARILVLQLALLLTASIPVLAVALLGLLPSLDLWTGLLVLLYVGSGDAYALLLNTARAEERAGVFATVENAGALARLFLIAGWIYFADLSSIIIVSIYICLWAIGSICLAAVIWRHLQWRRVAPAAQPSASSSSTLLLGVQAIPLSAGGWIIAASDRLVIESNLGTFAVGIYSANYAVPERILAGISAAAFMFLWPRLMHIHSDEPSRLDIAYANAFLLYSLLTIGPTIALMAFSPALLAIFADARYSGAGALMPIIAVSIFLSGVTTQLSRPTEMAKQYWRMSLVSLAAAAANLALTLIMVPRIGVIGAAIATLTAYGLTAGYYLALERERIRHIEWSIICGVATLSAAVALLCRQASPTWGGLAIFAVLYILGVLGLLKRKAVLNV